MTTLIGQQVFSLAATTLKMAATAFQVQETCTELTRPSPHWQRTYTLNEVSWHYSRNDCWMVIYDKVYDVTEFIGEHPGGYDVLLEYAGHDATIAFRGVGHSRDALQMMEKYCIGILVESERLYENR